MSAYDEGRDARHYGVALSQNPYSRRSQTDPFRSWQIGWADEDRDIATQERKSA